MDEETLMADIVAKLTQIGVYVDDDLPKYILEKIRDNRSIDQIKDDISLFLDSDTNVFIEWLHLYLNNPNDASLKPVIEIKKTKTESISNNEIDEEILDFEENIEEDEENESINNQDTLNKRKNDCSEENTNKKLMNNDKEPISLSNVNIGKEEKSNIQNNIIKLSSSQRLNDIGKMRRKAIEEKLKSVTLNNEEEKNHQEENDKFSDLRMKLEKKRIQKDQNSNQENKTDDNIKTESENLETQENLEEEKKEKCKFWPLCKKELDCIYYHPTVQCKQFPVCKFGEKCLNIHPICKFDALCSKKDCPFTHVTKKLLISNTTSIQCKFYPNCLNVKCPFLHPRLCMYGSNCKNTSCLFKHVEPASTIAKPHQLKWNSKKDNSVAHLEETSELNKMEDKTPENNSCLKDTNKVVVIVKEE